MYTDDLTPDEVAELLAQDLAKVTERVAALEWELNGAKRAKAELEVALEMTR